MANPLKVGLLALVWKERSFTVYYSFNLCLWNISWEYLNIDLLRSVFISHVQIIALTPEGDKYGKENCGCIVKQVWNLGYK